MKKKTAFVLLITLTVLSCVAHVNATVLGTIEHSCVGSGLGEFSEIKVSICYPLIGDYDFNTSAISFSWNITKDDVGKTFFASADTHEIFDSFACMLTDGIDDLLFLSDSYTIRSNYDLPGAERESSLINGVRDGVDFEGYTIDSIALTGNELFIDYHEAGLGSYTDYSYDITYTIYGEPIPEPATILLLGLGGISLILRKRSRE
jgi:hypothetical protein